MTSRSFCYQEEPLIYTLVREVGSVVSLLLLTGLVWASYAFALTTTQVLVALAVLIGLMWVWDATVVRSTR